MNYQDINHIFIIQAYIYFMRSFKFYCISLKRNILPILFLLFIVFLLIFSNSNFEILTNTVKTIHNKKSSIQLISVDDNYQTYSNLSINNNLFTIAITHKPDNADKIVEYFSPNIILAGHSHNGQVNLPIIGPLMKKIGSKKYIKSYYKINETELFISGGIGNTKYNMRLFTHPSINFFRLKSK